MELNREQIKAGNDKLAKVLGWFQEDMSLGGTWFVVGDSAKYVAYSEYNNYPHKGLPFHRDWNYLMEVVDKIGTLIYHRKDDEPTYNWKEHYSYGELFGHMWNRWLRKQQIMHGEPNLMNDLESIWSSCVAWIDWYEQNKNEILW